MAEDTSSSLPLPLRTAASVLRKVPGGGTVNRVAGGALDKVGAVSPRGRRLLVYTGAGVLGLAGVVEWPVAATGAAVAWLTRPRSRDGAGDTSADGRAAAATPSARPRPAAAATTPAPKGRTAAAGGTAARAARATTKAATKGAATPTVRKSKAAGAGKTAGTGKAGKAAAAAGARGTRDTRDTASARAAARSAKSAGRATAGRGRSAG
ncbi:hypothetical protein OG796_10485 [Streptomyces jietaisiensis]|uniref:Phage shock protein C (PspC) family protein n=1 Tax=Streptomyces griseoaurantiacus TaxID=68213 RepID=A0ABZ1V8L5_9ACTN|nr:hypothetical protein [Streptomyces jietaisiensis]